MELHIEFEQEEDGRWIAEVVDMPGVMVYGDTPEQARSRVKALALRVTADQIEEDDLKIDSVTFAA